MLLLWLSFQTIVVMAQPAEPQSLGTAEVVRGDWQILQAPVDGWQRISIPDFVNDRWPNFDGVVWYWLEWNQRDPAQPTALMLEYLNMAGAVYINDILVGRDPDLIEPLTRAWKTPRFFVLEPPVLKAGRNTLLVRVSALAAFGPGIGEVQVGALDAVHARYASYLWWRVDILRFAFAIDVMLGIFFSLLWLMRRGETAFGWYGLSVLFWLGYEADYIVTSAWPFASNYSWAVMNACFLAPFVGAFTMFVLRFCERHWPRFERGMWIVIALSVALMLLLPPALSNDYRINFVIASGLFVTVTNGLLIVLAWRGNKIEPRILSVIASLHILAAVHDMLAFLHVIVTNNYYADATAFINTLGIAVLLVWRYAGNLSRIENFNEQLRHDVDSARSELTESLQRQHTVEMTHARIGERLNIARDLHDGLGSSLLGSIAAIEHEPQDLPAPYLLKLLRELRDELRLIVDTSMHDAQDKTSFGQQLVPLRHRMTRLCDAKGIVCRWHLAGLDTLFVATAQALDALRFLQEALANVMKHSRAGAVDVSIRYLRGQDGEARLDMAVIDNGVGIGSTPGTGAGMQSLQARARRLGGEFHLESAPGRTCISISGALANARSAIPNA